MPSLPRQLIQEINRNEGFDLRTGRTGFSRVYPTGEDPLDRYSNRDNSRVSVPPESLPIVYVPNRRS